MIARVPSVSRRSAFTRGLKDALPFLPGVIPFGLVAGIALRQAGFEPLEVLLNSVIVFAGSSQVVGAQMISAAAPAIAVIAVSSVVNMRYLMYSASLSPWLQHIPSRVRILMAFLLVDQSYALGVSNFPLMPLEDRLPYYMGISVLMFVNWLTVTGLGAVLGGQIPGSWQLDFTIPLSFAALLVTAVKDRPSLVAAVVAGAVAIAAAPLPYRLNLMIGASCGIIAGVLAERRIQRLRAGV